MNFLVATKPSPFLYGKNVISIRAHRSHCHRHLAATPCSHTSTQASWRTPHPDSSTLQRHLQTSVKKTEQSNRAAKKQTPHAKNLLKRKKLDTCSKFSLRNKTNTALFFLVICIPSKKDRMHAAYASYTTNIARYSKLLRRSNPQLLRTSKASQSQNSGTNRYKGSRRLFNIAVYQIFGNCITKQQPRER